MRPALVLISDSTPKLSLVDHSSSFYTELNKIVSGVCARAYAVDTCHGGVCGGQRAALGSPLSPSNLWTQGISFLLTCTPQVGQPSSGIPWSLPPTAYSCLGVGVLRLEIWVLFLSLFIFKWEF